jgi:hypothetical protein
VAFPADYPIRPIHPSPIVTWTNGDLSAVRQFLVPAANVEEFIEDMLSTGASSCGLPSTFPGWPLVFIESINAEPVSPCCFRSPEGNYVLTDPTTELEGYTPGSGSEELDEVCWHKVVIRYSTREILSGQSGVREGTWVTYERNMSGEMHTFPNRNLYWEGLSQQLRYDTQAHKFIPLGDIVLNWNFVSEDDMCFTETNLIEMQGTVNSASYGGFIFPGVCSNIWEPETLLFLGYSTSLSIGSRSVFGTYCTAVEKHRSLKLQFKAKRVYGFDALSGGAQVVGWNHKYYDGNQSTPGWYRVVDDSGNPEYDVVDFANIFL